MWLHAYRVRTGWQRTTSAHLGAPVSCVVDRWQLVLGRKLNHSSHVNQMHRIASEQQGVGTQPFQEREPAVEFLGVTHFDREQLQLRLLRFWHEFTVKSRIGGIVRIPKQGDLGGLRDKLFHEIQALRRNFPSERRGSCNISAWAGEARDRSVLDRSSGRYHDDG